MDGSSTQRCHAIQDRIPRQATAVLIAADFDACVERQCAPAERPVVAAKRLFPYCGTLLSVICKVGCDGLALREFQRLSDRRRVPITRC